MELLNYAFPFNDFILPITLTKVNKHYFGKDFIQLESGKDLLDYLVSPTDSIFMRVESDAYEKHKIYWGDVVLIERNNLRYDGATAIRVNNEICIRNMKFTEDFMPEIEGLNLEDNYEYFGTIAYVLQSEEEHFLDMVGQELFIIT